jgi:predicted transcriptional regulator
MLDYVKGANLLFEVFSNPKNNAFFYDKNILTIKGNYYGETYDIVVEAKNQNESIFFNINVTENQPPIPQLIEPSISSNVDVSITLDMDYQQLGTSNSISYSNFVDEFKSNISNSLGITNDLIQILDIQEGSIIVKFRILNGGDKSPATYAIELDEQTYDDNSLLLNNSLTSYLKRYRIIEDTITQTKTYCTLSNDEYIFDMSSINNGVNMNYSLVSSNIYNNIVIDNNLIKIKGNNRDTVYDIDIKGENLTSFIDYKIVVRELPPLPKVMRKVNIINYPFTGTYNDYTVNKNDENIEIKLWGAGGWGNSTFLSKPGSGGYTEGTINVKEGDKFKIIVGECKNSISTSLSYGGGGSTSSSTSTGSGGGRTAFLKIVNFMNDYSQKNNTITNNGVATSSYYFSGNASALFNHTTNLILKFQILIIVLILLNFLLL